MNLSMIYATIAGFSFTAGSFFGNSSKSIRNDFFRTSTLFLLNCVLSIIYYLFFDLVKKYPDVHAPYLIILGFLFSLSFIRLLILLVRVPRR